MCGFVGVASKNQVPDKNWLKLGRDAMHHRGPDDAGEWWSFDSCVGLAHRRLSIIDLSPLGHQPMHLKEAGLSIVFNGEIYNFIELRQALQSLGYKFNSNSDTEVILISYLHWGIDCVNHFNGAFAFAIFDSRIFKLFLARDRAGEKPVFYRVCDDSIFFASELKGLLANAELPRRLEADALDCYLAMGFVPGGNCILEGYNKLPPAHVLTFDLSDGSTDIRQYWTLPEFDVNENRNDDNSLLLDLESLLEDAVAKQMIADVPVGILLSGGVDSSLITAMAIRRSNNVRTFSIGFPGNSKFDESAHAQLIAKYFNTEHTVLTAEPSAADLLPVLATQFDEPIIDSSMFPTWLVANLVRQHCTVAIGGDGGDELFGGYSHHSRILWMQKNLALMPKIIRSAIASSAEKILPVGFQGRNYLRGLDFDFDNGLPLIASYFDSHTRMSLLGKKHKLFAEDLRNSRIPIQKDLLQRITRMDFMNYLPEDILVKVDRASMSNSLEVRAPFLDYRLIEFAFGKVPSRLKTSTREKKILLKRLCERVLPSEFDRNRKQGFSIPINEWLKSGSFRDIFWDTLNSNECMFDKKTVQALLLGQDKGRNNGERLFALVLFELWRKHYKITL
jgi:asparagine synthase (glutamine-hydrolysing)